MEELSLVILPLPSDDEAAAIAAVLALLTEQQPQRDLPDSARSRWGQTQALQDPWLPSAASPWQQADAPHR